MTTKKNDVGLIERMTKHIQDLRTLVKEYNVLEEKDQTYIRSQIYRHTGGFGKIIVPTFDEISALEQRLEEKLNVS